MISSNLSWPTKLKDKFLKSTYFTIAFLSLFELKLKLEKLDAAGDWEEEIGKI